MKTIKIFTIASLFTALFFISPSVFSQQVVVENGIEYKVEANTEDDNSLSLDLIKSVKMQETSKAPKKEKKARTINPQELDNMLQNGNSLRFRKKRSNNKCFEAVKETCNSTKK